MSRSAIEALRPISRIRSEKLTATSVLPEPNPPQKMFTRRSSFRKLSALNQLAGMALSPHGDCPQDPVFVPHAPTLTSLRPANMVNSWSQ